MSRCDICHERWPIGRPGPRSFWVNHYLDALANWFTRARHSVGCSMPSKLHRAVFELWGSLRRSIVGRIPKQLKKRLERIGNAFARINNQLSKARRTLGYGRHRLWAGRRNGFRRIRGKLSMMRKKLWTKRLGLLYHFGEFICVVGARFKTAGGGGMTDSSSGSLRRVKPRQSLEAEFDDE